MSCSMHQAEPAQRMRQRLGATRSSGRTFRAQEDVDFEPFVVHSIEQDGRCGDRAVRVVVIERPSNQRHGEAATTEVGVHHPLTRP